MPPKLRRPAGVLRVAAKALAKAAAAKAKGKARPKPKAGPKGAAKARGRRDRRRRGGEPPAEAGGVDPEFNQEDFLRGAEVAPLAVPLKEWRKGLKLVLVEATYWEEKVQVSGVLERIEFYGDSVAAFVDALGTTGESLVRWKGKFPGKLLEVHFCHKDCGKVSKDGLVHCEKLKLLKPEAEEPWMKNLSGMDPAREEDELAELRRRSGEVGLGAEAPRKKGGIGSSSGSEESSKGKKAKKKKKRKKKEERKALKEKRKINGTKGLAAVFGSTGLDPDPEARKRAVKKAKKLAKKKGKRSTSSSGSRTSEDSSWSGEGGASVIFGQEVRTKTIWQKVPGALTGATLHQMQTALVQQSGQPWDVSREAMPPIFTQYWKAVLDGKSSRPMSREMHTLSFIVDLLLQGKPAAACDVATQRLKSLEQVCGGGDYRVAQRQELVPLEHQSMSSTTETLEASRLQREEIRAKAAATGKGYWERGRSKGDSEFWVKGKDKKGDGHKGKGKGHKGDGKKGDGKAGQDDKEKK